MHVGSHENYPVGIVVRILIEKDKDDSIHVAKE